MIKSHEAKIFLKLFDSPVENDQQIKNMIQLKPLLFQSLPHKKVTQDLVNWYVDCFIKSVAKINLNVENIPKNLLNQTLWEKIIKFDPSNFDKVPRIYYSDLLINSALNSKLVNFVFMKILNEHEKESFSNIQKYFIEAVKNNFSIKFFFEQYSHVDKLIDKDLIFEFLEVNPTVFMSIPDQYRTPEICQFALRKNAECYKYINNPTRFLYLEMCSYDFNLRKISPYYQDYSSDEELSSVVLEHKKGKVIMNNL